MNFAEANRRYFDAISDSYDNEPWFQKVNQQVVDTVRGDLSWIGIPLANTQPGSHVQQVRLLDYACGPGLMTRVFRPYVTQTLGIDISPNMITAYNARAREASLPEDVVHGVAGNLLDKSNPSPPEFSGTEWTDFHLVTVGFAFHHFEEVLHAAGQLKARLRPGGVLVMNDFLEGGDMLADDMGEAIPGTEGNHAVHGHGERGPGLPRGLDPHHGQGHHHDQDEKDHFTHDTTPEFKKKMNDSIVVQHFTVEGVKKFFAEAGFEDIDVVTLKEKSYMEFSGKRLWRTMLFARGRRPMEKSEL